MFGIGGCEEVWSSIFFVVSVTLERHLFLIVNLQITTVFCQTCCLDQLSLATAQTTYRLNNLFGFCSGCISKWYGRIPIRYVHDITQL